MSGLLSERERRLAVSFQNVCSFSTEIDKQQMLR